MRERLFWLRDTDKSGTREGFLFAAPAAILLFSYHILGPVFALENFSQPLTSAPLLPLLSAGMLAAMAGWEIFFRGFLLRWLMTRFSLRTAFFLHLAAINLVILPLLWNTAVGMKGMGIFRFYIGENLFEAFLALYFLRTGSVAAVAFLHGICNIFRFFILNAVGGSFDTIYGFYAVSDYFYLLILCVQFFAVILQLLINRSSGIREKAAAR